MASSGASIRKEPSLSSASATNSAPLPSPAPSPVSVRIPPITYPGSAPLCRRIVVIMLVVVVLPWVPATAMPRRPSITLARAAARCSIRRPRRRASASSGLSARIAVDTTSVSAPSMFSAACPTCTSAPWPANAVSRSLAAASLPETFTPRAIMIRAMPDMPAPPMPVKCTRPSSASGTAATGLTRLPTSAHRPCAARLRGGRPAMMFMTS